MNRLMKRGLYRRSCVLVTMFAFELSPDVCVKDILALINMFGLCVSALNCRLHTVIVQMLLTTLSLPVWPLVWRIMSYLNVTARSFTCQVCGYEVEITNRSSKLHAADEL